MLGQDRMELHGGQAQAREDEAFTITAESLLQGWTDPNGDVLSVTDLELEGSGGQLVTNKNGSWRLVPDKDFNGTIRLVYTIIDGHGGKISSGVSFIFEPVNDAPEVKNPTKLGTINEDEPLVITQAQLLENASDVDNDKLQVTDIKLSSGEGN